MVGDGGSNRNRINEIQYKLGVKEMGMGDETTASYMSQKKALENNFIISNFNIQAAAQLPNEINFIDNSVPTTEQSKKPTAPAIIAPSIVPESAVAPPTTTSTETK